jgi:sugar phosphate isomerase/epimerase
MRTSAGFELTYCSNIHAADGWPQVFSNIRRYFPEQKRRISPDARFGLGLRLSNDEAGELLQGRNLQEFASFLRDNDLYVALINGFPFSDFHDCALKDQVFAPDWHTEERVVYTLRLLEILTALLPDDLDGSISTCPLSYKRWQRRPDWDLLVRNITRVADAMRDTSIHLDIEPEPDGLIENTPEFVNFYRALPEKEREHIAICYDICHFAVEHERPAETIAALTERGIQIGRVQVSSALKVSLSQNREPLRSTLAPLSDATYLHQVIGSRERFADLPNGLEALSKAESEEWRIHYHVPLFVENYGPLSSTQSEVRDALARLTPERVRHLEIETYTWGVLPPDLKLDILDSIEREYRWVLHQL